MRGITNDATLTAQCHRTSDKVLFWDSDRKTRAALSFEKWGHFFPAVHGGDFIINNKCTMFFDGGDSPMAVAYECHGYAKSIWNIVLIGASIEEVCGRLLGRRLSEAQSRLVTAYITPTKSMVATEDGHPIDTGSIYERLSLAAFWVDNPNREYNLLGKCFISSDVSSSLFLFEKETSAAGVLMVHLCKSPQPLAQ